MPPAWAAGRKPLRGEVRYPQQRSPEDLLRCKVYFALAHGGERPYEDIARDPNPYDVLNWLVTVNPDGKAYLFVGPQPALSAHANMLKISADIAAPETALPGAVGGGAPAVVALGGGEAMGDFSIMNDFAGTFAERNLKNSLGDAVALMRESPLVKEFLPETIHTQSWNEGHLDPKTKSRGEEGHFASVFHDARNGISIIVQLLQLRKHFATVATLSPAEEEKMFAEMGAEALRRPTNIDPILALLDTQKDRANHTLPAGLQRTYDLLLKSKNGPFDANGLALSRAEMDILDNNLMSVLVALQNQPIQVHYLGETTQGPDGKYHIKP